MAEDKIGGKMRDALAGPLHEALHTLEVRIPDLTVEGCHCNLVTQVALDAILALPEMVAAMKVVEAARPFVELLRTIEEDDWSEPPAIAATQALLGAVDEFDAVVP